MIYLENICFDIGAYDGNWALSNVYNFDKIIAIEASFFAYEQILKKINNYKIIPLHYVVYNNDCKYITFHQCTTDNSLSTLNEDWLTNPKSRFYDKLYHNIELINKTISIDKLIEIYGKPNFIKINVGGAEYECISSLNTKIDLLCFKWISEFNEITLNCLDYLEDLGYTKFYIQDGYDYTFKPPENEFIYPILNAKILLLTKIDRIDEGMIWCK
jgi:FkbM family methyltransferase